VVRVKLSAIFLLCPEIPLSTIKYTIRRQTLDNTSRPRKGRPRVLSEQERDYVYDIVTYQTHISKCEIFSAKLIIKSKNNHYKAFYGKWTYTNRFGKNDLFL
jgi:hypothetical protein